MSAFSFETTQGSSLMEFYFPIKLIQDQDHFLSSQVVLNFFFCEMHAGATVRSTVVGSQDFFYIPALI
jgi:hypothetical protein